MEPKYSSDKFKYLSTVHKVRYDDSIHSYKYWYDKDGTKKEKNCLRCRHPFQSKHKGNHVCPRCNKKNQAESVRAQNHI